MAVKSYMDLSGFIWGHQYAKKGALLLVYHFRVTFMGARQNIAYLQIIYVKGLGETTHSVR